MEKYYRGDTCCNDSIHC